MTELSPFLPQRNLELNSPIFAPSPESVEKDGIAIFTFEHAQRLVNDAQYLEETSKKTLAWINEYNQKFNLSEKDITRNEIQTLLSTEDPEVNILRHEARHLMALPESHVSEARFAISAMGSLTPDSDEYYPEGWELFISAIGGVAYGYEASTLTTEQKFLLSVAPEYLSAYDANHSREHLGVLHQEGNPKAVEYQNLLDRKIKATREKGVLK